MSTMRAIRVHEFGGPEVLSLENVPVPVPGPDQVGSCCVMLLECDQGRGLPFLDCVLFR